MICTDMLRAYCGVDCSVCEDYRSGRCPSCRKTEWTEENICMPVKCCREKKITGCGQCTDFPCEEMKAFYEESEGHREAYCWMKKIRNR